MPDSRIIHNARVVHDDDILEKGWVLVVDGRIADIGDDQPPSGRPDTPAVDAGGRLLLPGYVDVHVHGGDGASFGDGAAGALHAARFHGRHGTTSLLAGLSTAGWGQMCAQAATLAGVRTAPGSADPSGPADPDTAGARILGTYLEGPFLSTTRKGAHDPDLLLLPTESRVTEILDSGGGSIATVTIAPEITDGLPAIGWFTAAGVRVSLGHSDADGDEFAAGVEAGGTCLTHTFNGMRPPTHRDPAVLALLTDSDIAAELICDGLHVHPVVVRMVRRLVGTNRLVLITDSVAWAGRPDGVYREDGRPVEVRGGRVWLQGTDTLAGSCLTMEQAVRNYAAYTGAGPVELARVSSTNAAARLGLDDQLGRIRAGYLADLVLLDPDLHVSAVMRDGRWIRSLGQ